MALPTQNIQFQVVGVQTDFLELNSISILNLSTDPLNIIHLTTNGLIKLNQNQSVTITSSTGFVLPTIRLDSGGSIFASVITT
jgi:hypothetical protein